MAKNKIGKKFVVKAIITMTVDAKENDNVEDIREEFEGLFDIEDLLEELRQEFDGDATVEVSVSKVDDFPTFKAV